MRIPHCDREQEVLDALRAGRWAGPWGEDIRRHAAACRVCAEVVLVAQAIQCEDSQARAEARLPSAGLVWWKARLAARRVAEQRATQPIALVERVAQCLGALTLLGLSFWQWPRIASWLSGAKVLTRLPTGLDGAIEWMSRFVQSFGQSSGFLLLASASTFLLLLAFTAYVVWREE
jgi:hypothetical protein